MNFVQEHLVGRVPFRDFYADEGVQFRGKEAFCPFHEDRTPSLSIDETSGLFRCHAGSCGASGDPVSFLEKRLNLSTAEAIAELRRRYLNGDRAPDTYKRARVVATYDYRDEHGELLFQVCRDEAKDFCQRRPDGAGGWIWNLQGARRVLYRMSDLIKAGPAKYVWLVEGEKDADNVSRLGLVATTNPGGAGKWRAEYTEAFRGRDVIILPDNDEPGRKHANEVARSLAGVAATVRVLELPGLPPKGDVSDWIDAHDATGLEDLAGLLSELASDTPTFQVEPKAGKSSSAEPVFRTLLDLERNPPPAIRFIVAYLLAEQTLDLLFGKAFGGKSLFALQISLHAAAMLEFLTFTFPRPLRVLYLDEEMGVSLLSARIEKMKSARAEFRNPDVLQRVGFFSRAGLRLDDEKKLEFMRRKIGEFPGGVPDLIFMDTLRRMHRGEEKDSGEMAKLMDTCSSLVEEFKTTLVPIHHSKKGPNDEEGDWREAARGSGDLIAASQTVIALWKSSDLLFSMRADVKAAGEIQPFPMTLDPNTLLYRRQSDEERIDSAERQRRDALEQARAAVHKLLRKLKERGTGYPPSLTTIEKTAGVNVRTAREAVGCLVEDGELLKVKRRGQGGGFVYVYPEDGQEPRTPSDEGDTN